MVSARHPLDAGRFAFTINGYPAQTFLFWISVFTPLWWRALVHDAAWWLPMGQDPARDRGARHVLDISNLFSSAYRSSHPRVLCQICLSRFSHHPFTGLGLLAYASDDLKYGR